MKRYMGAGSFNDSTTVVVRNDVKGLLRWLATCPV
jgi:hypothetical protein